MKNGAGLKVLEVLSWDYQMESTTISYWLTEVRYIPDLRRNLISLRALEGKGYRFGSITGGLVISKAGELSCKALRTKICIAWTIDSIKSRNLVQEC